MEITSHNYKITDSKGGGHWSLDFIFQNRAVDSPAFARQLCS